MSAERSLRNDFSQSSTHLVVRDERHPFLVEDILTRNIWSDISTNWVTHVGSWISRGNEGETSGWVMVRERLNKALFYSPPCGSSWTREQRKERKGLQYSNLSKLNEGLDHWNSPLLHHLQPWCSSWWNLPKPWLERKEESWRNGLLWEFHLAVDS